MVASCENCDSEEFRDISHDYYGGCWYAECAACGEELTIKEEMG